MQFSQNSLPLFVVEIKNSGRKQSFDFGYFAARLLLAYLQRKSK